MPLGVLGIDCDQQAYIAKFSLNGTLLAGTYYDTGGGNEEGKDIYVTNSQVFLVGSTSQALTDTSKNCYPPNPYSVDNLVTSNGYQQYNAGGIDGFIAIFDKDLEDLEYGTLYGGSSDDEINALSVEEDAVFPSIYVCGETKSGNGAMSTVGVYQEDLSGSSDGFIAKFDTTRQWGTYYGGTGNDKLLSIHKTKTASYINPNNNKPPDNVYDLVVGGSTASTGMATSGAYETDFQGGMSDGIIARFTTVSLYVLPIDTICAGEEVKVPVKASGFEEGNTFYIHVDDNENFTSPLNIPGTSFNLHEADTLSFVFPDYYPAGNYYIKITSTNPNVSRQLNTPVTFYVKSLPKGIPEGPESVCEQTQDNVYKAVDSLGQAYDEITWYIEGSSSNYVVTNFPGMGHSEFFSGVTSTVDSLIINWGSPGIYRISYSALNSNGCEAFCDTLEVEVKPLPEPEITGDANVCIDGTGVYQTTNVPGNTYDWSITPAAHGTISGSGNQISVTWNYTGTKTVHLTETQDGCSKDTSFTVEVRPLPNPDISGQVEICERTQGAVYTALGSGNSYTWAVQGGTIETTSGNQVFINWGSHGTAKVMLTEETFYGCVDYDTLTVNLVEYPKPVITGNDEICVNETSTYEIQTDLSGAGNTYTWSVDNGQVINTNGTEFTVLWNAVGSGTVYVSESNGFCDTVAQFSVTVYPYPEPQINGRNEVCENETNEIYSIASPDPESAYLWEVTGGSIVGSATGQSINVNWGDESPGQVKVTETRNGCSADYSLNVTIYPYPEPEMFGPDEVCAYEPTATYFTNDTYGSEFFWSVSGGVIIDSLGNSITVEWGGGPVGTVSVSEVKNNCETTDTKNITIKPLPEPEISGAAEVCENSLSVSYSTANTGNTYIWKIIESGGGFINGSGHSVNINWNGNPGVYHLAVTEIQDGCSNYDTLEVTVHEYPQPQISGDQSVCTGDEAVVYSTPDNSALGSTYQWSIQGGSIISGHDSPEVTVNWGSPGTGKLTLKETRNGCETSVSYNVTKHPYPEPEITGDAGVCELDGAVIYETSSNPGSTYQWSITGGQIAGPSDGATVTVDWGAAGTGVLYVTEISNECSATDSLQVQIHTYPEPEITGDLNVCEFTTGQNYQTQLNSGSSYQWDIEGGQIMGDPTLAQISVNWASTGTGKIYVTETSNECSATDTIEIQIHPYPEPVINGDNSVCANAGGVIYSTQNNPGSTYSWSVQGGTIEGANNTSQVTVNWGSAGTGVLEVTETSNECSKTASYTVTINPYPEPVINGDASVCEGEEGVIYSTPANLGSTFNWIVTGGNITDGQNTNSITVKWSNPGNGTVELTETTNECSASETFDVEIHGYPEPQISGDAGICENEENVVYSTAHKPGNNYQWEVSGGSINSGQGTNEIKVSWGSPGNYTVKVNESSNGCSSSDEFDVTVHPYPEPDIQGPDNVCDFEQNVTYSTPANSAEFNWEVTGGTLVSGQGTASIVVNWGQAGTGSIKVTETLNDCSTSEEIAITINESPSPDISGDQSVCEDESGVVYSTTDLSSQGHTYSWELTGGVIVSGQHTNSITVNWDDPGTGTITVTEISNGCETIVSEQVTINPLPIPEISGDIEVCAGETGSVYSTPDKSAQGHVYYWEVSGGTIISGQNTAQIEVDWGSAGAGEVKVIEVSSGCDASATQEITIHPLPEPVITGDSVVCENQMDVVYGVTDNSASGSTYKWTVQGGAITGNDDEADVIITWGAAGSGIVTVTETSNGCSVTDEFEVEINNYPNPQIDGNRDVCEYNSIIYTTDDDPELKNTWYINGGSPGGPVDGPMVDVLFGGSGTAKIKLVQEVIATGCIDSVEIEVSVNPQPVPVINGERFVCADNYETYSTTSQIGVTNKWQVIGGTIEGPDDGDEVNILWDDVDNGRVYLKRTYESTGCSDSLSMQVKVRSVPEPVITGQDYLCAGSVAEYSTTLDPGIVYHWQVSGGEFMGSSKSNVVKVKWGNNPAGWLKLVKTMGSGGCSDSSEITVTITPNPEPVISGSHNVCEGGLETYKSEFDSDIEYTWNVTGGIIKSDNKGNEIIVEWGKKAKGKISLIQVNKNSGCADSVKQEISINALPDPAIFGADIVCKNCTEDYSASDTGYDNKWEVTGGDLLGPDNGQTVTIEWDQVDNGTIKLIQTNPLTGCRDSVYLDVELRDTPAPTISGKDNVCSGSTESYVTSSNPELRISWEVLQGGTIVDQSGSSVDIRWDTPGTGIIKLVQEIPSLNFIESTTKEIIINDNPVITISEVPGYCLDNGPVSLDFAQPEGGSYQGDGVAFGEFDPEAAGVGTHEITYIYEDENGCDASASFDIEVYPVPQRPEISVVGNSLISTSTRGNVWYFEGGKTELTGKVVSPNDTGFYRVAVVNDYGCVSEMSDPVYFERFDFDGPLIIADNDIMFEHLICNNETQDTIQVTNHGGRKLILSGLEFDGANKQDFSLSGSFTQVQLDSGQSEKFIVKFVPRSPGLRKAQMVLKSNAINDPKFEIDLVGVKDSVGFRLSDNLINNEIDFGILQENTPATQTFEIINTGTVDLEWQAPVDISSDFTILSVEPLITPPGGRSVVTVEFRGRPQGSLVEQNYSFIDDACGMTKEVKLKAIVESNSASATISLGDNTGEAGAIVEIPVYLKDLKNINLSNTKTVSFELAFNATLLTPAEGMPMGRLEGLKRVVPVTIDVTTDETRPVRILKFLATLGNDSLTVLEVRNPVIGEGKLNVKSLNGLFKLTGICYEGGPRLLHSGESAGLKAMPNPASNHLTLDYRIIEKGRVRIYLANALGEQVKTIVETENNAGEHSKSVNVSDLPNGMYFIIYETQTMFKSVKISILK
ncbi:MAG: choice-of-anchor D domain-containing protein [Candidatus Kapaibacterium sp.]